jgi:hypothetical protein
MNEQVILIEPVPGTMLAESKDEARRFRTQKILPALERGDSVALDFALVGFATQSYVHALISEAIRRYKDDIYDRLTFRSCTKEVQEVVLTVFQYTMAAADAAAGLRPDIVNDDLT